MQAEWIPYPTMLNTIGKLPERIVARKLAKDLEDKILPTNQKVLKQETKIHTGVFVFLSFLFFFPHLHITCVKDTRRKTKHWLWQSLCGAHSCNITVPFNSLVQAGVCLTFIRRIAAALQDKTMSCSLATGALLLFT